jgi:hypothetical protein
MQADQRTRPIAALFDSSMDDGIEQALALAMVLACDSRRDARLGSVSVSRNSLQIAGFCELMVRFYRGEQPGTAPEGASVPIGMFDGESDAGTVGPMIRTVLNRNGPNGQRFYPRGIEEPNDTADPVAVIRNALSAQPDQNAVVVLAGPPVNLLGLLALPGGTELVRNKVRVLVNAYPDEDGFAELVRQWPGAIIQAGDDLNLQYPGTAIEQDFQWAANHPLVDAYRSAGTMPYDAPAHMMAAVLYAVHPDDNYFSVSEPEGDGRPGYRRLMADAGQRRRALGAMRELVGTQPPQSGRGRGR